MNEAPNLGFGFPNVAHLYSGLVLGGASGLSLASRARASQWTLGCHHPAAPRAIPTVAAFSLLQTVGSQASSEHRGGSRKDRCPEVVQRVGVRKSKVVEG